DVITIRTVASVKHDANHSRKSSFLSITTTSSTLGVVAPSVPEAIVPVPSRAVVSLPGTLSSTHVRTITTPPYSQWHVPYACINHFCLYKRNWCRTQACSVRCADTHEMQMLYTQSVALLSMEVVAKRTHTCAGMVGFDDCLDLGREILERYDGIKRRERVAFGADHLKTLVEVAQSQLPDAKPGAVV